MDPITATQDHVVAQLVDAGIPATTDATKILTPGAWVYFDSGEPTTLDGNTWTVTITVYLISRSKGNAQDASDLGNLMLKAAKAIPTNAWRRDPIVLPNYSPDPLPALTTTLTLEWSE